MDPRFLILVLLALIVACLGAFYRRRKALGLSDVSDEEFLSRFYSEHPASISSDLVLQGRERIASILGIPPAKIAPDQSLSELSRRFEYLGQFSVAWTDLDDEAESMRRMAGLEPRSSPPETVGALVEDLVRGREELAKRGSSGSS